MFCFVSLRPWDHCYHSWYNGWVCRNQTDVRQHLQHKGFAYFGGSEGPLHWSDTMCFQASTPYHSPGRWHWKGQNIYRIGPHCVLPFKQMDQLRIFQESCNSFSASPDKCPTTTDVLWRHVETSSIAKTEAHCRATESVGNWNHGKHDVYYFTLVWLRVYLYLLVSFCSCVCFCIPNCFGSYCVHVCVSCIHSCTSVLPTHHGTCGTKLATLAN